MKNLYIASVIMIALMGSLVALDSVINEGDKVSSATEAVYHFMGHK
jgi:opacity protein-like surface antigen